MVIGVVLLILIEWFRVVVVYLYICLCRRSSVCVCLVPVSFNLLSCRRARKRVFGIDARGSRSSSSNRRGKRRRRRERKRERGREGGWRESMSATMRLRNRRKAEKRNLLADRPAYFLPFLVVTLRSTSCFDYWQNCWSLPNSRSAISFEWDVQALLSLADGLIIYQGLLDENVEEKQFNDDISERDILVEVNRSKFRSIMLNILSRKSFRNAQSKEEASNKVWVISFFQGFHLHSVVVVYSFSIVYSNRRMLHSSSLGRSIIIDC